MALLRLIPPYTGLDNIGQVLETYKELNQRKRRLIQGVYFYHYPTRDGNQYYSDDVRTRSRATTLVAYTVNGTVIMCICLRFRFISEQRAKDHVNNKLLHMYPNRTLPDAIQLMYAPPN